MFKKLSRLRKRPSASMVVATLALFVALSGGAYAAVAIPKASVGSAQLKSGAVEFRNLATGAVGTRDLANNAVSYTKIAKGEIGHARVSQSQIQWRVTGTCAGEFAIQSIADTGKVTCTQTLPSSYSTAGLTEPLTSPSTPVVLADETLPTASAYSLTADPYIVVNGTTGAAQNVLVTCEIAAGTVNETRSVSFALGADHEQQVNSIPLTLQVPTLTAATESAVACTSASDGTTAPTVQASSGINAIQTVNTVNTTAGTSTAPITLTTPTATTTTATTASTATPAS
jgi:hypothetical protein